MKRLLLLASTLFFALQVTTRADYPVPPDVPPNPGTTEAQREDAGSTLDQRYQLNIYRLVDRIGRTYRVLNLIDPDPTAAGDLFTDLALVADFSYADIEDSELDGRGYDRSESVYLTGVFAEDYQFGIGVSEYSYDLNGIFDLEQQMLTLDMFTVYTIMEDLNVGAFFQISQVDIENSPLNPVIGDSFERYGAGLIASYRRHYELFSFGVASSVASFNKQTIDKILDDDDTAWITVFDLEHFFTDNLTIDLYCSYYQLIEEEEDNDDGYFILGGDLTYQINNQWAVTGGYERPVDYNEYDEHRFNATISYSF